MTNPWPQPVQSLDRKPRQVVERPVEHPVEQPPQAALVLTLLSLHQHHIPALAGQRERPRNLGGRMLQVGVEEGHVVGGGVVEAGEHRRLVAEVAGEVDHLHAAAVGEPVENLTRTIDRAVVDIENPGDDTPRRERGNRPRHLGVKGRQGSLLVVDRHDDVETQSGVHGRLPGAGA